MRRNLSSYAASGLVLLVAVAFLVFALHRGLARAAAGGQELTAVFSSSEGIVVGADVQIAGVTVGRVVSVRLDRQTGLSRVTFSVPPWLRLGADTQVGIVGGGLSGSAALSLGPGASHKPVRQGDVLTHTSSAESLEQTIGRYIFGNGGLPGSG